MVSLRIKGAEQLGDLAKDLRAAGESGKGLRRELYRGMNRATKPLKAKARLAAATKLPQSGGLATVVARSKFSTRTRAGRDPGVSIIVMGSGLTTDRGYVKHPVFGNREVWVRQSLAPGWFTNTMRVAAPSVRKELVSAMDDIADKIAKG